MLTRSWGDFSVPYRGGSAYALWKANAGSWGRMYADQENKRAVLLAGVGYGLAIC